MTAPRIDLGDDHSWDRCNYQGEFAGLNVHHKRPDGSPCVGFISLSGRAWSKQFENQPSHQAWEVVSEDPLTLSPSILCRVCGDHGYIKNGRWEKA